MGENVKKNLFELSFRQIKTSPEAELLFQPAGNKKHTFNFEFQKPNASSLQNEEDMGRLIHSNF